MKYYYLVVLSNGAELMETMSEDQHPMDKLYKHPVATVSKAYNSRADLFEGEGREDPDYE